MWSDLRKIPSEYHQWRINPLRNTMVSAVCCVLWYVSQFFEGLRVRVIDYQHKYYLGQPLK